MADTGERFATELAALRKAKQDEEERKRQDSIRNEEKRVREMFPWQSSLIKATSGLRSGPRPRQLYRNAVVDARGNLYLALRAVGVTSLCVKMITKSCEDDVGVYVLHKLRTDRRGATHSSKFVDAGSGQRSLLLKSLCELQTASPENFLWRAPRVLSELFSCGILKNEDEYIEFSQRFYHWVNGGYQEMG